MADRIKKIRVLLDVTVRVPFETTINLAEFDEWAEGDPPTLENIQEYLSEDEDYEWLREAPAANAAEHEVQEWTVARVEEPN